MAEPDNYRRFLTTDEDLAWWENVDGSGTFGARNTIDGAFPDASAVIVADLDGDGDVGPGRGP